VVVIVVAAVVILVVVIFVVVIGVSDRSAVKSSNDTNMASFCRAKGWCNATCLYLLAAGSAVKSPSTPTGNFE
jgi:preprotein translocase subunit SecG